MTVFTQPLADSTPEIIFSRNVIYIEKLNKKKKITSQQML